MSLLIMVTIMVTIKFRLTRGIRPYAPCHHLEFLVDPTEIICDARQRPITEMIYADLLHYCSGAWDGYMNEWTPC